MTSFPHSTPPPNSSAALDAELEEVVSTLTTLQTDLRYQHAQETLKRLVDQLDLTARERAGIDTELQGLESMLDKLEHMVVQIAVFGMVGRGKSSLLNALVGQPVFETGPTHGVTQSVQRLRWQADDPHPSGATGAIAPSHPRSQAQVVALPGLGNSQVELVDTPGIDEVEGADREQLAQQIARQSDLILFVVSGDITRIEYEALRRLRDINKPMLLVFNKIDQYPPLDRQAIYQTLRDERLRHILTPDDLVMAAASPLVTQASRHADGTLAIAHHRGQPDVQELKLKILQVLRQDGKSLVALNTMLYADAVNDQVIQRKMDIRDRSANEVIWNSALAKSMAIAINPITMLDLVGGTVIDVVLIHGLSRLYGLSMTQQDALGLLQKILLGMGGVAGSELLAVLGLGSLKSLLGIAAPASGGASLVPYTSIAIAQAAVAGVCTYTIGQVTKAYLANGASWGPDGPKAVVHQILDGLDETSILNRIKDELRAKLGR